MVYLVRFYVREAIEFFIETVLKYKFAHKSSKFFNKNALVKCIKFLRERRNLRSIENSIIPIIVKTAKVQIENLNKYDKKTNYKTGQRFKKF